MKSKRSMRLFLGFLTICLALAPGLWAQSRAAQTGCGFYEGATPKLKPAAFVEQISDGNAVITGLWKFSFTAKGNANIPDGAPIDAGYATWHADGTEIMNSGRPPMTGSFCMGAWKALGHRSFKLNHIALSWDPSGTTFVGPASIRERVTVNSTGDSYSGSFTLTQYDTNGNVIVQILGVISAQRVTAD
jgi:hypothetical protein